MLGIQKSGTLPRGPIVQVALLGILIAAVAYLTIYASGPATVVDPTGGPPKTVTAAPTLDPAILAQAKDATREQRLVLEPEPYGHLLSTALNVVPAMADSLQMPARPVPVAELRANRESWRGRWLWYKGKLERIDGPKPGPIDGRSVYEATLRLNDDQTVLFAFSMAPGEHVHRGGFARVAGYLLKLRDTTFPTELAEAPMLIGRDIERDYDDWGPVTELDPSKLAFDDGSWRESVDGTPGSFEPGPLAWRDIEDDQDYPLWHLAAWVRGQANAMNRDEWRRFPAMTTEIWNKIKENRIDRGSRLRLLGVLVKADTYAAHANPAGIRFWTVAWVSVHDLGGGKTIPVWIPDRVDHVPIGTGLEVRGYYYRRFVYTGRRNDLWTTPLLVAAGLDRFDLDVGRETWQFAAGITFGAATLIVFIWLSQRRLRRSSLQHEAMLAERRRKRRQRATAAPQT
ncbi:MAG: hypothetical protein IPK26_23405 [Planctomycetes bacterium]|nr:hypothetical protein [Planctomycetota bacterium]